MPTSLGRIVRAYAYELARRVKMLVDPPLRVPASDLEALMQQGEAQLERVAQPRTWLAVAPGGIERCSLCGALAAPRGNRLSVHYPTLASARPCPRSWPPATTRSST